jgi:hypothetical protein
VSPLGASTMAGSSATSWAMLEGGVADIVVILRRGILGQ